MEALILGILSIALIFQITSCSGLIKKETPWTDGMNPSQWHRDFLSRQKSFQSLSGQVYLRLYDEDGQGQTVSGSLLLGKQGRFRLELYNPIGGLIALYIGDASKLAFFDAQNERWLIGRWKKWKNLDQPLSRFMNPGLIPLLVGQLDSVTSSASIPKNTGSAAGASVQVCHSSLEYEALRWTRSELDSWISEGKSYDLAWEAREPKHPTAMRWDNWLVCWEDWQLLEQRQMPKKTRVFKIQSKTSRRPPKALALFWEQIKENPSLDQSLFQWKKALEELRYPVRLLR